MKPDQQRIAIAKACGWKHKLNRSQRWITSNPEGEIKQYSHKDIGKDWPKWCLPDYLTDLNAMHEAEKTLTDKQEYDYQVLICRMFDIGFKSICAPAAQRAEAFLKTLGLWVSNDERKGEP